MTISIIIPCYNAQKYLRECLDSLLAQRMENFEVILIDDGSRDATAQIAGEYVRRDKRFHLIQQENSGVSVARNAGLSAAQGEWILFVDADDLLPPDALENLLACAKPGVQMVVSLHETFGEDMTSRVELPQSRWMDKTGAARCHAAALRLIEGDAVLNIMCNKLHRRAFLKEEGIVLTPGVRMAEDALFNLEAVLCAQEIAFCDRVTYRYRIHGASATQTHVQSQFDAHLPWFCAMAQMLTRRNDFERYYPAYFSSVVLRLYKDGGVRGVMRDFCPKAKMLLMAPLDERRLSLRGRLLRMLCRRELYPAVYPVIYPFEVLDRKMRCLLFWLRERRLCHG